MSTNLVDQLYERKKAILVEDLRLWILSQPHLNSRIDDNFLGAVLKCCQFDLEESKIRLDTFYTLKNQIPSVLNERNVTKELLGICQLGVSIILPYSKINKDIRINFSKYPVLSPSISRYSEVLKVFFMLTEISMIESRNANFDTGIVYVFDLKEATFKHSLKIDIKLAKKICRLIQYGLPLQIESVHFINVSRYFNYLIWFARSLLSRELKSKCFVHTSMESFYNHVPQKYLPVEYGGQNANIQTYITKQIDCLKKYGKYFEDDSLYSVNEALRRKKQ